MDNKEMDKKEVKAPEADPKEIILDVENLNTSFISDRKEVRIVKGVSFQLKRGSALAVVGESGCGKSVTMNSIMRFFGQQRPGPRR